MLLPLRARCVRSSLGLRAHRQPDKPTQRLELYPAFDWASRSPRPALCYRPLLAFPRSLFSGRVTSLEPRTPHQPEKLKKLSKNDLVLLFLILESIKTLRVYVIYFQSSAGSPQAGDRIWCRPKAISRRRRMGRGFSAQRKMPV